MYLGSGLGTKSSAQSLTVLNNCFRINSYDMRHSLGSAEWSLKQSQKQNKEYTVWLCTPLGKGRLRVHTAGGGRSGSSFFWTWRQPCRFLIDVTPKTSLAWPKYLSLCALLLWIASQRSTPKVCQVAGFSLWVCSDIYVTAECVLKYMSVLSLFATVLLHLENVCHQGLHIPSFAEEGSCVSTHVCGEEVNPEIMERGMTSKLLYYG